MHTFFRDQGLGNKVCEVQGLGGFGSTLCAVRCLGSARSRDVRDLRVRDLRVYGCWLWSLLTHVLSREHWNILRREDTGLLYPYSSPAASKFGSGVPGSQHPWTSVLDRRLMQRVSQSLNEVFKSYARRAQMAQSR